MFKCQKNEMQLTIGMINTIQCNKCEWSSYTSNQTLWRIRKNSTSCNFCSFRCLRKRKLRPIMKIIMFKCQKKEMQLGWSLSTSNQTLLRIRKYSTSCDFCSYRCLRKRKSRPIIKIIIFKCQKNEISVIIIHIKSDSFKNQKKFSVQI